MKNTIINGETYLGIELGSTRIKAVLIDKNHNVLASGSHNWENKLIDNVWTYSLDAAWNGVQDCYSNLLKDVQQKYNTHIEKIGAIGISGMMHGYLVFDKEGNQLVSFRTWRNTITSQAAKQLTELFNFNIPQRWSVAHLYQSIIEKQQHVEKINYLTTLAGYIHLKLTGKKVLGMNEASGMFPIDDNTRQFDKDMLNKFDELHSFDWKLKDIMPEILSAGTQGGVLTDEGAKLLDPSGKLQSGIPMCPPEGDAGTGMVATNAVRQRTGNVSAGTSIFAMVVLEKTLSKVYPEIDMVTTPSGDAVAMVHCNNCLSDTDAWIKILGDAARLLGAEFDTNTLYSKLFDEALKGSADCGGLLSYNYISGEHISKIKDGRPIFVRKPDDDFSLANFMRTHLYSTCATLKIGMDILEQNEGVAIDSITGHGGLFKQAHIGQRILSSALNAPVNVMSTAGEGGAWGIAVLAAYMMNKASRSLPDYLRDKVFADADISCLEPNQDDVEGFNKFMQSYKCSMVIEEKASQTFC